MGRIRRICKSKQKPDKKFFFYRFPRYCEIRNYLQLLALQYPRRVRLETIGQSHEGRPIEMIVIQHDKEICKHSVMIEAGIHAREWLTNTTALYLIHHLVHHPKLLTLMDFYIIPCINPDGYEYTHTCNRLWRKNMNKNGSDKEERWGVDLNRNFSYGYGLPGSSSDPTSFMYRGERALSEPEAQCIEWVLHKYANRIKLYLAIHCFGNLIMYPWGFTQKPIWDKKDLCACGMAAKSAMKRADCDSHYTVGCVSKVMYISSGSSSDYARGQHKIKFSYTIELERGGKSGFTPPPSKIVRVAKETLAGVEAMVKYIHRYYKKHRSRRGSLRSRASNVSSASNVSNICI